MDNELPGTMLTVRHVASILNVHTNSVRRWAKLGLLKSYKLGPQGAVRFREEDVLEFLRQSANPQGRDESKDRPG